MVFPWRSTKGVKPDALKGASPVLNGGDEETGLCRPRLVATQLECGQITSGLSVPFLITSAWRNFLVVGYSEAVERKRRGECGHGGFRAGAVHDLGVRSVYASLLVWGAAPGMACC